MNVENMTEEEIRAAGMKQLGNVFKVLLIYIILVNVHYQLANFKFFLGSMIIVAMVMGFIGIIMLYIRFEKQKKDPKRYPEYHVDWVYAYNEYKEEYDYIDSFIEANVRIMDLDRIRECLAYNLSQKYNPLVANTMVYGYTGYYDGGDIYRHIKNKYRQEVMSLPIEKPVNYPH